VARYTGVAAAAQAIVKTLGDASSARFRGTRFTVYQASDFAKRPTNEVVSLYLYRVGVTTVRRNLAPRVAPDGRRYRPAFPVDLFFLLTAWCADAARQQLLLGSCMRILDDMPIMPPALLNDAGIDTSAFGPGETIEIVADPLPLQDLTNIWQALRATMELSVAYVVRMVALESDLPIVEAPLAQTRVFEYQTMDGA
jgi:hypothetical protein